MRSHPYHDTSRASTGRPGSMPARWAQQRIMGWRERTWAEQPKRKDLKEHYCGSFSGRSSHPQGRSSSEETSAGRCTNHRAPAPGRASDECVCARARVVPHWTATQLSRITSLNPCRRHSFSKTSEDPLTITPASGSGDTAHCAMVLLGTQQKESIGP